MKSTLQYCRYSAAVLLSKVIVAAYLPFIATGAFNTMIKKYYNAKDLAKKLKVHYRTVLYWIKNDKIKDVERHPTSNEYQVPIAEAQRLARERGVKIEVKV